MKKRSKVKIISRHKADSNNEVVTVSGGGECYRRTPCDECPWRKDSPVGAFPAEAYRHSARTAYDMAGTTFACHMAGKESPTTCAGFLLKGSAHNMLTRIALSKGKVDFKKIHSDVPLYESYREMAEANGVSADDPVLAPCRD